MNGWIRKTACAASFFAALATTPAVQAAEPLSFERSPTAPAAEAFALVGGTVHIGDGTVVENASLVVRGGRIVSVGPSSGSPPANAVDVSGKIITPGFVAANTSIGLIEIGAEDSTVNVGREGDPVRAGYDAANAVDARSTLIAVQAIEGVTSAAVTPSGGLISGQIAWIDLLQGADRTIVARGGIAMKASLGRGAQGSRAATLAKLAEVFDDASFYASRKTAFDRRALRDLAAHRLDLEALKPVLGGGVPLVVQADRVSDILALLELAEQYKLRLTIVSGAQALLVADELAKAKVTVIVKPSANLPRTFDRIGQDFNLAAELDAKNVRVAIATLDEPYNLRNLKQEAGIAIRAGLSPSAAMRAVTLNVAVAYGMDADYGSLAAGKVANVVVWNADPFELSSMPEAVYIRGRSIPLVSRQTKLRDRHLRRRSKR